MLLKFCKNITILRYFTQEKGFLLFRCVYNEGTRPYGFGGGEGSGLALTIFSKGT